jgi:hypothetical protein
VLSRRRPGFSGRGDESDGFHWRMNAGPAGKFPGKSLQNRTYLPAEKDFTTEAQRTRRNTEEKIGWNHEKHERHQQGK